MLRTIILCSLISLPNITLAQISLNTSATLVEISNSGTHSWIDSTLGNGFTQDVLTVRGNNIKHVNETSNILRLSNFNFNLPLDAVVSTVSFTIRRRAIGGTKLVDQQVRLETFGINLSNNLASSVNWSTNFEEITYSGTALDWGLSLTAAALNSSDFALIFQVGRNSNSTTSNQSPEIDFFGVSISYSSVLPIDLMDFYGQALQNGERQISWQTASECNNSHFLLQRKTKDEDFTTIARIEGGGTSSSVLQYDYYDSEYANDELLYYQLIQVDYNGQEKTYQPIAINVGEREEFTVYPNPSIHYIVARNIGANSSVESIQILSFSGEKIFELSGEEVSNEQPIDIHELKAGKYLIRLQRSNGSVCTKKFVKN